jgi:hypothetical protein
MRRLCLPVSVLLALFSAMPAFAQIYQWHDAEGKAHYADIAPPGVNAILLRVKPGSVTDTVEDAATAGSAQPKSLAEQELEFRQRRAEAAEAQAKAEDEEKQAAERARNCEQARNQLAALKSGQRIARLNSKGEREYLDEAGRVAEIERTEQYAASVCK